MASTQDRVLLPAAVRPSHYSLELKPDLVNFTFDGSVNITVNVLSATNTVVMHAKDLSIVGKASFASSVASDRAESVEIAYNSRLSTVSFTFPASLPLGEGMLRLAFTGELNNKMAGFYRSKYNDVDGSELYMAATQFESLDARRCFPCWDEPAAKATFSATLVVPSNLCALSNMPEMSSSFLPGGWKRVVFDTTPVMSTYLLAFCVGKFDCLSSVTEHGVALNIYTLPGMSERGRFALACGKRCLDYYDDYFQIPYPLPKLDMIVVTEFAAGAMENWGLVTYRENALMLDENADVSMKQRVALVICHELAHQWFGNLVTMAWWCDLWLNEGFASWMQHSAVDHLFPEWCIWEQYTTDTIGMAQKLDALRSSHPIQVPIKHAEEVEEVFDHISYAKGSTVVRMAECVLGKENFRKGLQLYFARHKYSNTETTDLWQAWTDVSGIDMNALMTSWTEKMGYPYLKVLSEAWSDKECVLKLQQSWFLADGTGDVEDAVWNIPLTVATSGAAATGGMFRLFLPCSAANLYSHTGQDSAGGMEPSSIASEKVFERRIPLSGSDSWVKLNAGQSALLRVAHSESMLARMLEKGVRDKGLSPIDRAALLDDQYSLATAGLAPVEAAALLLSAYGCEDNSTVWRSLHPILLGFNSALRAAAALNGASSSSVDAFVLFAKNKIVLPALSRFGWDPKEGEPDVHKLMRGSVFALVEEFCWADVDVASEARRRFDASVAATMEDPSSDTLAADIKVSGNSL